MSNKGIRRLNKRELSKILILVGFAIFFIRVSINGQATMYVHPILVPFLLACAAVFIIIAGLSFFRALFSPSQGSINKSHLLFAIPLILAFLVPPTAAIPNTNGTMYSEAPTNTEVSNQHPQSTHDATGTIDMNDHDYMRWLDEFYNNTDQYVGREVDLTAFVYRDESCGRDEFIAARYVMVCCAADLQLSGLDCQYSDQAELESDSWVRIHGRLKKEMGGGTAAPVLQVETIHKVAKPDIEYVYFLYSWE